MRYGGRPRREKEGRKEGRKVGRKERKKEGRKEEGQGWMQVVVGKVIYHKKKFSKFNTLIRTPVLLFHHRAERLVASYNTSLGDCWSVVIWEFTSCPALLYCPNIRYPRLTCVTCIFRLSQSAEVNRRCEEK